MESVPNGPHWLTPQEVSRILGVPVKVLIARIKDGELPCRYFGSRMIRIRSVDLPKYRMWWEMRCLGYDPENLHALLNVPPKPPAEPPTFTDKELFDERLRYQKVLIERLDAIDYRLSRIERQMDVFTESLANVRVSRKNVQSTKRVRVYDRDMNLCRYCGTRLVNGTRTLDHLIPVSRGGSDDDDNLVAACSSCNAIKRDRTVDESGLTLLPIGSRGARGHTKSQ